jgi:hypothetical protein
MSCGRMCFWLCDAPMYLNIELRQCFEFGKPALDGTASGFHRRPLTKRV